MPPFDRVKPRTRPLPTLPPVENLWPPLQVGDEVEFESHLSTTLRRGEVVEKERAGRWVVNVPLDPPRKRGRRPRGVPPPATPAPRRKMLWYPQFVDIRRVYRDGKEVAQQPGLLEAPVPPYTPPAERKPAEQYLFLMTPPPGVVLPEPTEWSYAAGDVVSFEGRYRNIHEGEVEMIFAPLEEGQEIELRVKRLRVSTRSCPRLSKVRRVWRNGELVALRGDLYAEG